MTSLRHLRSATVNKRPDPTAMVDGQLAMNYDAVSPGLFFKDDNGVLVKIGPVHVGTTAPNISPASGGTAGNSLGEQWLDTTSGVYILKVWDGSAWRSESGTFVDVAGDTMTGALVMDNQQSVRFRETTANGTNYIALQAPSAVASDKTITLPDVTGTVVTTGDTGTVTSTMILDGTILNADVNVSAAIAGTKISPNFGSQTITTTGVISSALGAEATPGITFTGDLNTGIYSPGADQLAVATNGVKRVKFGTSEVVFNDGNNDYDFRVESDNNASLLFVDASTDRFGIGHSSPATLIHVADTLAGSPVIARIENFSTSANSDAVLDLKTPNETYTLKALRSSARFDFEIGGTPKLSITSAGLVGIGTTSPGGTLDVGAVSGAVTAGDLLVTTGSTTAKVTIGRLSSTSNDSTSFRIRDRIDRDVLTVDAGNFVYSQSGTERARIDSSGRLLVGTSSGSDNNALLKVQGNVGGSTGAGWLDVRRGSSASTNNQIGLISFSDNSGNNFAWIEAYGDAASGASDYPGRLVFSTCGDGASSPTVGIIINNSGTLYPATDNAFQAGSGSFRWTAIYAVNGTIQTSDVRQKTDVSSCSLGSAFIKSLQPVSYKWIEGGNTVTKSEDGETDVITAAPGERTHWGFLAQDVKAAVDDAGVDFGGWILTDKNDPDSAQGLRYDQFIAPLTKALQEALTEIDVLKVKVAALEAS